jgi:hypothetical protein
MPFNDSLFNSGLSFAPSPPPASGSLGRLQLGDLVPLYVSTVDSGGYPTTPDAAPTATVKDANSNVIVTLKMPMLGNTSTFSVPLFLGQSFALGTFSVSYSYTIAGITGSASASFEVVAGGDPGGRVIAMTCYDRPESQYVVVQLQSGYLMQGRNPTF